MMAILGEDGIVELFATLGGFKDEDGGEAAFGAGGVLAFVPRLFCAVLDLAVSSLAAKLSLWRLLGKHMGDEIFYKVIIISTT